MYRPNLIVMLTCHDVTVPNAREVFASCRDLAVSHWGFKDNGIPLDEMKELVRDMRSAGKRICFETLALTEADCLASAEHAVVLGVDFLIGGVFFPSVAKYLNERRIAYAPYIGPVVVHDSVMLSATSDDVREILPSFLENRCFGATLMAYENEKKNPLGCMDPFFARDDFACIVAGRVNSYGRIMAILAYGLYGFAIGSSFFNGDFGPAPTFRGQIQHVLDFLDEQLGSNVRQG